MTIDLEQLLKVAQVTGALNGSNRNYAPGGLMSKEASLTLSTMASMYGCCGLFDLCGDNDLLSLTVEAEPFLDWLTWRPNNECNQFVKLLTYVGPAGTYNDSEGTGAAAACDDAAGVEFGTCEVLLPDKGRIKRAGPVRDLTDNNRRLCDQQPLYMKDGMQITDELMWSVTMAGLALKQDLKRMLVTGNASTANQFSGLQTLVNTGYRNARDGSYCTSMDSIVLNWGSNPMSYAYNGTHNLIDYLIDIIRRIRTRAMWSNLGPISVGDMVLVMPSHIRDCLLDAFTCWSVCTGNQYDETVINTFEGRTFRDRLNGGAFGMGQIWVDGTMVPIVTYDWLPLTSAAPYFTGDIYVLTRRIGLSLIHI
jgi:ferredoxin-like protein FixX